MIKFNRVGNKLGLAGLVGILLSIGVVANEMRTEASVSEASRRADVQQQIAGHALRAEADMRSMQLASRGVRLATTKLEIDKADADLRAAKAAQDKSLDAAALLTQNQENTVRLAKIKELTGIYAASAGEVVGLQKKLLELYRTRNVANIDWDRHLDQMRKTTSVTESANWAEVNLQLRDADGALNAVRASAWRFAAMNEASEKQEIVRRANLLRAAIARAASNADDGPVQDSMTQLSADSKKFMAATDEATKTNDAKIQITADTIVPTALAASELMGAAVSSAQQSAAEARAGAAGELEASGRINLALGLLVVLVLVCSVAFSFVGVARPMTRLNGAMTSMAAGNLDVVVPGATRGDEIGDIAKTVTVIRANAERTARAENEARADRDRLAGAQRKRDMVKLADDFESAVGEIVETVSSASTELEASAGTLTATAEHAQELTTLVSSASEDASINVQAVASATEEMAQSITEIGRQVQESASIAGHAVDQARKTNDRVAELAKAAARIGDVVELINTIAGQTNLLALNATIEAARAGDAGRGFAVVANEVKALAEQTAKATGDISQQISGIQAATRESVGAIKEIGDTIGKMSEIASSIASAVEQQGAATQEISRNVQQAAQGTIKVSANIGDVQRGANQTGSASSQVLSAAQSLSQDSNRLKLEVGKFLDSVRAA
jgi:methyl-accepting chemotaxis protein